MFPGYSGEPDDVLNPKKKVWEMLQPDLHTNTELMDWIGSVDFVVLMYCVSVNFWNFNCNVAALSFSDWIGCGISGFNARKLGFDMLGVIVSNWNLSVFVGQTSFQGFFFSALGNWRLLLQNGVVF